MIGPEREQASKRLARIEAAKTDYLAFMPDWMADDFAWLLEETGRFQRMVDSDLRWHGGRFKLGEGDCPGCGTRVEFFGVLDPPGR